MRRLCASGENPDPAILPPAQALESLRAIVLDGQVRADLMLSALTLNAFCLAAGLLVLRTPLDSARRAGSLVQMGK